MIHIDVCQYVYQKKSAEYKNFIGFSKLIPDFFVTKKSLLKSVYFFSSLLILILLRSKSERKCCLLYIPTFSSNVTLFIKNSFKFQYVL